MQKSNFFDKVYKITSQIPKGKVATYGQIAELVRERGLSKGVSPRVVGFALHANKNPKVPCHRVVDKNGRLAPNFAFNGWREQRNRLLEEGVTFKDQMHVDLEKCLWKM